MGRIRKGVAQGERGSRGQTKDLSQVQIHGPDLGRIHQKTTMELGALLEPAPSLSRGKPGTRGGEYSVLVASFHQHSGHSMMTDALWAHFTIRSPTTTQPVWLSG